MRENGDFLNFDCVYGNYYAMTSASISEVIQEGKTPIKEIHPSNHRKIKEALPQSISILITGQSNERAERKDSDDCYYENIDDADFDLVFFNDMDLPIDQNAYYLNQRIASFQKYKTRFPSSEEIDSKNQAGYSLIADEFTEEKRIYD